MEITYSNKKGLICYEINGQITFEDMRRLLEARIQLSSFEKIKVLAIVSTFRGYESLGAVKEAILGDLGMMPKLSKYAMITDISWLRFVVWLLDFLVPKSELKAFSMRERKLAMHWLE